jgi:ATP adenylyltransferase
MDRLWSPWRYQYVSRDTPEGVCIFCEKGSAGRDQDDFVIARGEFNFVLLNLFPYTSGHLMIAPYAHVGTLSDTSGPALAEMMRMAQKAETCLKTAYRAPGLNLGMNLGKSAGAGIADHIHLHMLPRWPGDANFMTTVAETRVLPEDLRDSWEKLRRVWGSPAAP